ncbi:hypothetical protein ACOSQ2_031017 [Xanthoceras sorbifolium]
MSSQVAYSTNKKIKIRIKGRKLESSSSLGSGVVDIKLMELLKSIMEDNDGYGIYLAHWRLSIRKVSTPENIKISDKHLLYIAERTIGLEELDLLGSSRITGAGFAKAICNWKNVKSISLGKVRPEYYSQIIEKIGKNCSRLKTLYLNKRNFRYDGENGTAIVQKLVQARRLVPVFLFPEKERLSSRIGLKDVLLCRLLSTDDDVVDTAYFVRFVPILNISFCVFF